MKTRLALIAMLGILIAGCSKSVTQLDGQAQTEAPVLDYTVNLNDRGDDTFKVRLRVRGLSAENNIYQFAATAPGTYITMDMGRYVRDFRALDKDGGAVVTTQVSTNQWQLSKPEKVAEIQYAIAETWDTPVDENKIYRMCGSSLEDDHALINGQTVFGYVSGWQERPIRIRFEYPSNWLLGTALDQDDRGYYHAMDYDHLVDSPVMMGVLTRSEVQIDSTSVEVYTYSKSGNVLSGQILQSIEDILYAAARFTEGLPVDRYTFLFHFEDQTVGAWEHSYSSTYTYAEEHFNMLMQGLLPDNAAHEFYHIVTPLNIHSEIIEEFNFVTPEPSQHLWLYEGVTEWAAHMMQLRASLIDLDTYLSRISQKINVSEQFPQHISLTQLAGMAFSKGYVQLHPNIYMKGALVAGLLDIRLLELSDGRQGLREVLNELSRQYGPERAFSETGFFDDFVKMTHPDIASFFDRYVIGAEPLPVAEYYGRMGIQYIAEVQGEDKKPAIGYNVGAVGEDLAIMQVDEEAERFGLAKGDIITALNGEPVNLSNIQKAYHQVMTLAVGEPYTLTVRRGEEVLQVQCEKFLQYDVKKHVLQADPDATGDQLALRQAWLRNM